MNPWAGNCGTGKGIDSATSGFEGPWTTNPTVWDNQYFKNLINYEWELSTGSGGAKQWYTKGRVLKAQPAHGSTPVDVTMLTADLALIYDAKYKVIVERFAADQNALDKAFSHAWYKLMSRDMGPHSRCLGNLVPPAQPFQNPLPPTPTKLADFDA